MAIITRGQNAPLDIFLQHAGVTVYRTYRCDEDAGDVQIESRIFTVYPGNDESACFDISLFPEAADCDDILNVLEQKGILCLAIDNGHLDSVGPRGFRVNVSFSLVDPDGAEEEIESELTVPVEDLTESVALLYHKFEREIAGRESWKHFERQTTFAPGRMMCKIIAAR